MPSLSELDRSTHRLPEIGTGFTQDRVREVTASLPASEMISAMTKTGLDMQDAKRLTQSEIGRVGGIRAYHDRLIGLPLAVLHNRELTPKSLIELGSSAMIHWGIIESKLQPNTVTGID